MTKRQYQISFLIVFTSLLFHAYLMNTHYEFKYGFAQTKSICSINETLNCESVSISQYSYLLGVPIATWGFAFHLSFLFVFLLTWVAIDRTSLLRILRLFALLSVLASVTMAAISFALMQTYCVFCMALYVFSFLTFIIFFKGAKKPYFPQKTDFTKNVLIALGLIPVLAFLLNDMSVRGKGQNIAQDVFAEWERTPAQTFDSPLLREGNIQSSTFHIAEFADFQCIHCRDAAHALHSFVRSKPDVQFSFYVFPLDGSCNSAMTQSSGKSCLLAKAVYCAEKQKKGWAAHQWIFDRFGSDENSKFETMANDIRANFSELSACLQSDEATQFVTSQAQLGQKLKVEGTPAVFVNGKRLTYGHMIFILETLYKKLHP